MAEEQGWHIDFDTTTARPAPYRGLAFEMMRWVCLGYLKLTGWTCHGDWPNYPKAVMLAAPHTSNWDAVNMLAVAFYYRVRLRWMAKQSLVRWPFGALLRWAGCIPIDRSKHNDMVSTMVAAFATTDAMILAIAPEGTRSLNPAWKSGFYQIARLAKVPIVLTVPDYPTRTCVVSGALFPSGDYPGDLARMQHHYRNARGKHVGQFSAGATAPPRASP